MHKVFINDKPLIFDDVYKPLNVNDENFLILSESEYYLEKVLLKLEEKNTQGIIYLCASPEQAWNTFLSRYVLFEAAGGVVKNDSGELLVIYRKKRWDLPKGKLDYNETPEAAAIREIKEECGLKEVETGKFLIKTFHTYSEKNKFVLKKTHWYAMATNDNSELVPQAEEDIEEARWMTKEKIINKVIPATYASIRDVFKKYFEEN